MREKNIVLDFVARVLLICTGTLGILEILISCASCEANLLMLSLVVGPAAIVYVICMSGRGKLRLGIPIVIVLYIAMAVLNFSELETGAKVLYNDIANRFNQTSQMNFALDESVKLVLQDKDAAGALLSAELTFMIYIGMLLAYVIAVEVVYIGGLLGGMVVTLPVFLLFMAFNCVPDENAVILCVIFIFANAAFTRTGDYRKSAIVAVIGIALSAIFLVVVPARDFTRLGVFINAENIVKSKWSWVFATTADDDDNAEDSSSNTAVGGINGGQLGRVNSIHFTRKTMLTVNTTDTGKNQYIKQFVGQNYGSNSWTTSGVTVNEEEFQRSLMNAVEKMPDLQEELFGSSESYYNKVLPYTYTAKNALSGEVTTTDTVRVWTTSYQIYEDFQKNSFTKLGGHDLGIYYGKMTQNYADAESRKRQQVRQMFTTIPNNIKSVLVNIIGNQSDIKASTVEEKEAYIQKVNEFLQNNYSYTTNPGKVPDGEDFVDYFLTESKRGYCTYFATAATLMYRYAGIPARYVEGYVIREEDIQRSTQTSSSISRGDNATTQNVTLCEVDVQDTAAHAWVEVYMNGYGWVVEEVTPPSGIGNANLENNPGLLSTDHSDDLGTSNTENQTGVDNSAGTGTNTEQPTEESVAVNDTAGEENVSTNENGQDGADQGLLAEQSGNAVIDGMNSQLSIFGLFSISVRILTRILLAIAVCAGLAAVAALVIVHRWNKRSSYMKCLYKRRDISALYQKMEHLLAYCKMERADNIDYEVYAEYLDRESVICREHHIKEVTAVMLEYTFGNKEVSEMDEMQLRFAADHIVAIMDAYMNTFSKRRQWFIRYVIYKKVFGE